MIKWFMSLEIMPHSQKKEILIIYNNYEYRYLFYYFVYRVYEYIDFDLFFCDFL